MFNGFAEWFVGEPILPPISFVSRDGAQFFHRQGGLLALPSISSEKLGEVCSATSPQSLPSTPPFALPELVEGYAPSFNKLGSKFLRFVPAPCLLCLRIIKTAAKNNFPVHSKGIY